MNVDYEDTLHVITRDISFFYDETSVLGQPMKLPSLSQLRQVLSKEGEMRYVLFISTHYIQGNLEINPAQENWMFSAFCVLKQSR